jgi:hypothetical protein
MGQTEEKNALASKADQAIAHLKRDTEAALQREGLSAAAARRVTHSLGIGARDHLALSNAMYNLGVHHATEVIESALTGAGEARLAEIAVARIRDRIKA